MRDHIQHPFRYQLSANLAHVSETFCDVLLNRIREHSLGWDIESKKVQVSISCTVLGYTISLVLDPDTLSQADCLESFESDLLGLLNLRDASFELAGQEYTESQEGHLLILETVTFGSSCFLENIC